MCMNYQQAGPGGLPVTAGLPSKAETIALPSLLRQHLTVTGCCKAPLASASQVQGLKVNATMPDYFYLFELYMQECVYHICGVV